MITVIALNHSITCFNHYIFDSTQTYVVLRNEEYLKFLLGKTFQITAAIEYRHNATPFRDWNEGVIQKRTRNCKKTKK